MLSLLCSQAAGVADNIANGVKALHLVSKGQLAQALELGKSEIILISTKHI